MSTLLRLGLASALFVATGAASASEPPPPVRAAPEPYVVPERPTPSPLAHRGFQLGLRTGVAIPVGYVSAGSPLGDSFGPQIPILLEAGFKPDPHVFLGAYLQAAYGGVVDRACRSGGCSALGTQLGALAAYHAAPADWLDPWFGLGIGYEWLSQDGDPDTSLRGPVYGRVMTGFDYRASRLFGVGPFVDASFGRYTHVSYEDRPLAGSPAQTIDTDIGQTRMHIWMTLGLRFVLLP